MIVRKKGMISVRTERVGIPSSLFPMFDGEDESDEEETAEWEEEDGPADPGDVEKVEMLMEGQLVITSSRAELIWEESELSGMEGATTKLGFSADLPGLVSMLRDGTVSTALVFEERRRHICLYNTPFSSFEVCVQALHVDNTLTLDGHLFLDYLIEIRGSRTERCKMWVGFREDTTDRFPPAEAQPN